MMTGARVRVLIRVPVRPDSDVIQTLDDEYVCTGIRRVLREGETTDGGYREYDIIQFWARHGGLRTVRASNIVSIR